MTRPICPHCDEEVSYPVFDAQGHECHWLCVPVEDRPPVRVGFVPETKPAWLRRNNAKVLSTAGDGG